LVVYFIPITFVLEYTHASAPTIFFCAALSIIPIARLISHSTEQLATYTGDAVGGLLNASFGNLPEVIIAIVALKAGLHEMVLASLAGSHIRQPTISDWCFIFCRRTEIQNPGL
jgi:Ca2+:H+ antiporter